MQTHSPTSWDIHGDPDRAELRALGLDPDEVLDFSVCINPFGPSPHIRTALERVAVQRYPDRLSRELRQALANWLQTGPERILVGNGDSELIWLTCLAMLRPGDRVLVPEPTYSDYARAATMMQAVIVPVRTCEQERFALSMERMRAELRVHEPRVTFLCNPNNPTGTIVAPEDIVAWADEFPACLFVVDEAYLPLAQPAPSAVDLPRDNIIVLRSMTKDFALAGLRLGFAVARPELIDMLAAVQPPWSVNAMAQAAGVAALQDLAHLRRTCGFLREAKECLIGDLRHVGLDPWASAAHFFLVRVGDGAEFRRALLRHRIVLRDGASFGLPAFVRIATRRPDENSHLVDAIQEVLR